MTPADDEPMPCCQGRCSNVFDAGSEAGAELMEADRTAPRGRGPEEKRSDRSEKERSQGSNAQRKKLQRNMDDAALAQETYKEAGRKD